MTKIEFDYYEMKIRYMKEHIKLIQEQNDLLKKLLEKVGNNK